jgi:hypothetical protein
MTQGLQIWHSFHKQFFTIEPKFGHLCFWRFINSKSYEVIKMDNLTWTKVENTCKDHNVEVTFSFTPYPLFQWYPQSNEILLNLSMNCETQHLMHKVRE